ncbi:hypothetical protein GW17_00028783 [Ensete ventricosum]|nr:hypothetical protein GW17_00028783 [Ensete ventricosum]
MEGSEAPRNIALIPSVTTLMDSKFRVDLYRGSPLPEHYRGSLQGIRLQELKKY